MTYHRELNATSRELLYIPSGFAHGFQALTDDSIVLYHADRLHSPAQDTGIRWDSFGFSWPIQETVLSERDQKLPRMAEFTSPF
jgi:dTDP-4-dehydrorhamnose 3,5-epimerase-like enzyme